MATLSNSLILSHNPPTHLSPGSSKPSDHCIRKVSFAPSYARKTGKSLIVRAASSDGSGSGNAAAFVGGFILGGLVVGTLGCVYAPQISNALAGADRKELMRKLPKFIYDEDKALEKTRKVLTEKIAQLNSAIDEVSNQLRSQDVPNGAMVDPDELETAI